MASAFRRVGVMWRKEMECRLLDVGVYRKEMAARWRDIRGLAVREGNVGRGF